MSQVTIGKHPAWLDTPLNQQASYRNSFQTHPGLACNKHVLSCSLLQLLMLLPDQKQSYIHRTSHGG